MHILMTDQNFAPEEISGAILVTELATDLVRRGHDVTFVTSVPNYPTGRVFPGYRNNLYQIEWRDGVRVIRIWSYIHPEKTFWRRILNYGTFSAMVFFGGLIAGRTDIIMSYSPPLPLGISAWLLSKFWRIPWLLRVEDLYPDAAVAAGLLHNPRVIAFFSAMERFLYRHAQHISLISEGFRRNLLAKGVPDAKLSVMPVWADPDVVRPMPKENSFRKQHDLAGKFVVMYAGTLGYTSNLDDVLAAAELITDDESIQFVIVGDGVKKASLESQAIEKDLKNVLFLPFQPRESFSEMLAAADMSLVTLNSNSSHSSLPSKTFNIMASARPILAITPSESEIDLLVQDAQCGVNVPTNQPQRLAQLILELKQDPEKLSLMGSNGRSQLENKFSRFKCVDLYENMLMNLQRNK
jgi:colanic acid biosynthesis glycosyl transferase WcaI